MAMKRIAAMLLASVLLLSCVGCAQDGRKEPGAEEADLGLTAEVKPATDFTAKANAAVYDELDFDDKREYEFATRGLIDAPETLELKDEDGTILWSQEAYAFLDDYEKAPDSVNPSLWENTKNNHAYGLFEVTDGIYQVRGYDMANLTVVKGDTGWIVFDTLMSVECSQAAMQLIEKNLGKFPVKAVIISHSHADHFGGIAGVMAKEDKADETLSIEDQLASGKIPVITPVGFTEHSVKENVYAGKGMGRRSNYQYGILLTPGVTGKLAQGIGFLGAGTIIITARQQVKGLTTAAGLWASACLGLAIGAGFYSCAFICIAYMAACMYLLPPLEQRLTRRAHHINISLEIERMEHLGAIVAHLHDENIRIFDFAVNRNGTGPLASFLCQFSAILPERRDHPELLAELSALEGVILIEEI